MPLRFQSTLADERERVHNDRVIDTGGGTAIDQESHSSEGSGVARKTSESSSDSARNPRRHSGLSGHSQISAVEAQRRPCCCISYCEAHTRSVHAESEELEKVLKAMKHLTLKEDVVLNGELIPKDSHLLRIGRMGRRWTRAGYWELDPQMESDCKKVIKEIIDDGDGIHLTFACPRISFPWCIILKAPCCTFFMALLLVGGVCAAGIRGNIVIDTNTDSFLDSDSDASTYYNAFLDAVKAESTPDDRRLQSTGALLSEEAYLFFNWRARLERLREAASLPVLDKNGRWHFYRYFARAYCLLTGIDIYLESGKWVEVNRTNQHGRKLANLYTMKLMSLVFATRSNDNILSPGYLSMIRSIETRLKAIPEWDALCVDADAPMKHFCDPGISFTNVVFASPVVSGSSTTLKFDGAGTEPLPMELAVNYAREQDFLQYFFPDGQENADSYEVAGLVCADDDISCNKYEQDGQCQPFAEYEMFMRDFCPKTCNLCGPNTAYASTPAAVESKETVTALRATFNFYAFCCDDRENPAPGKAKLDENWDNFVAALVEDLSAESGPLRVFYSGDGVETYEAMNAVYSDLMWALGSYSFVIVYATLHTRSFFLAIVGLFLVMLSIPSALALFALASNSETISLMSCLSIFIVIGIGSDMLFVYTDFWKQSIQQSRDPVKRLRFTYMQAATSTAATTFTTAMSFLANLASVLRPLREFGFFMGACVVMAWLIMFLGYPPILVMGERCHRRLRRCLLVNVEKEEDKLKTEDTISSLGRKSINVMKNRSSVAIVKMLDPEKVGVGEVHRNLLRTFANFLGEWKRTLSIFFLILTISSCAISVQQLEQATGVPQIFPDDHNQVLGKEYRGKFAVFQDENVEPFKTVTECNNLFHSCTQYKCQSYGRAVGSSFECKCYLHGEKSGECMNPAKNVIDLRVLAREGLSKEMVAEANFSGYFKKRYPSATSITVSSKTVNLYDILIENWETGAQTLGVLARPGFVTVAHPAGKENSTCNELQLCYCGIERCIGSNSGAVNSASSYVNVASASSYGSLQLWRPNQRRLPAEQKNPMADALLGRHLQSPAPAPMVSAENTVDVNVVFGLTITATTRLVGISTEVPYQFDPSFDMQDPWTQRNFEKLCAVVPTEQPLMKIARTRCWLLGFRDYWKQRGKDWPLRPTEDVNAEMYRYATTKTTDDYDTTLYAWFDDNKKLQATYVVFFLSISNLVSSSDALEVKEHWDSYFASFSISGVWHASKLWVRAEAEKVIIGSTVNTLCISLGCVLLGIMAFTFSLHLAVMVMLVVLAIIVGLLFFMVVIMKWPIGAIEVLCLIVFVGFAVDYCLHVAHKYHTCHINHVVDLPPDDRVDIVSTKTNATSTDGPGRKVSKRASIQIDIGDKPLSDDVDEPAPRPRGSTVLLANNRGQERFARTQYALERMGGAVVGSACTTCGCAAFLLPCQLVIFTKIGAVVMAVTMYAIIYTILPLPSLLMIMGPCGGDMQRLWSFLRKCNRPRAGKKEKIEEASPAPYVDEWSLQRRYVLHMPVRSMSAHTPVREKSAGVYATRTRVTATG